MSGRPVRWLALATVSALLTGAAWTTFGSAATLTVTPKNASAFRTCVLTGYPTSTNVMFDAWVDQVFPNSNNGGETTVQVRAASFSRNRRAFLRFDLTKCVPTVANAATVERATLRLNLSSGPDASRTYNIKRVTGPCPEAATTCWTQNNLTWNNQPTVATGATTTLALTSSSPENQYYAFDVSADVAAMVAGSASNYGWRIEDSTESNSLGVSASFKAKYLGSAAGAPQLVVVYSP